MSALLTNGRWSAIHHLTDAVLAEGVDRIVQAVNNSFLDMFGLSHGRDEMIGHDAEALERSLSLLFTTPDDYLDSTAHAMHAPETVRGELFQLRDGRMIERDCVHLHNGMPMDVPNALSGGYLWLFRDVTEREALSEVLRDVTNIQSSVIEASGDGILFVDSNNHIVDMNMSAMELLQVGSVTPGMRLGELFPPALREHAIARVEQARLDDTPVSVKDVADTVVRRVDHSYVSVSMGITPMMMRKVPLVAIFLRDVSDRRAWEIRLGIQEEMARSVAQASAILMTIDDEETSIESALQALGWASRVDRVYMSEVHEQEGTSRLLLSLVHEWVAPGVKARKGLPGTTNLPWPDDLIWWASQLTSGLPVQRHISEMSGAELMRFQPRGVVSVLVTPMLEGGRLVGLLAFECCQDRAWTPQEVNIMTSMALILSAAVRMKRRNS